jgi:hypothetical protein
MLAILTTGTLAFRAGVQDSIWDRLDVYANGRLRWESTFDQLGGEDRHRGRMRFRLGAAYGIAEDVTAEARLSTSSDGRDANNPHWDFGDGSDGFSGSDVVLDRFYLSWTPYETLELRAGKLPHAFQGPPVSSELVWDDDVQPAGAIAVWTPKADGRLKYDLRVAEYVAAESGSNTEPSMFGAQGHARLSLGATASLELASAYMGWGNTGDLAVNASVPGNQGNTSLDGDFGIWDTWVAATVGDGAGRTTLFGQYIDNVTDDTGEDRGAAFGARVGTQGKKDDWNVFATYYDLDANAVFSPVAQDDTPIAGTGTGNGMSGIIAGTQYFLRDNLSFRVWVLTSDADESEDPFRIRFDLDFLVK